MARRSESRSSSETPPGIVAAMPVRAEAPDTHQKPPQPFRRPLNTHAGAVLGQAEFGANLTQRAALGRSAVSR
jgi:hypothetical protein